MTQGVFTGADRRKSVRFRFDAEVKVEHAGGVFDARGTDFNDDALGILHGEEIDVGTEVTVHVTDELRNKVTLKGEVARSGPADEGDQIATVIKRTD